MPVQQGDKVSINYTAKLEDGTVIDSSQGGQPLEFEAGGPQLIPGVSNAVVGMEVGETKTVTIPPEEGYGPHQEGMVQKVPRNLLPPEVKVGDQLRAQAGDQEITVMVTELDDEFGVVDANHPLAGQTLVFELELLSINQ